MSAAAYMYSQMLQRNIYIYGVYAIGQARRWRPFRLLPPVSESRYNLILNFRAYTSPSGAYLESDNGELVKQEGHFEDRPPSTALISIGKLILSSSS